MTDTIEGRCPQDCVMCRYDRHVPIDPNRAGTLEAAIVGTGLAGSAWISLYVLYLIGDWIARTGLGKASLIVSLTAGALVAVWANLRNPR